VRGEAVECSDETSSASGGHTGRTGLARTGAAPLCLYGTVRCCFDTEILRGSLHRCLSAGLRVCSRRGVSEPGDAHASTAAKRRTGASLRSTELSARVDHEEVARALGSAGLLREQWPERARNIVSTMGLCYILSLCPPGEGVRWIEEVDDVEGGRARCTLAHKKELRLLMGNERIE